MVTEVLEDAAEKLDEGKCKYIMRDGGQCGQDVGPDWTYCLWHDPNRREEAKAARKKGGQLGSPPPKYVQGTKVEIEGLDDVLDQLGEVISNLQALRFTPAVANSMINALRIASSCYLERQDRDIIQQQIKALEKAIEEHGKEATSTSRSTQGEGHS